MRTANADAVWIHARHGTEQLGAFKGGNSHLLRRAKLRVIVEQSCSIDHHLGITDIFRAVPHRDRNAERAKLDQIIAFIVIRPSQGITLFQKNLSKRAHSGATDADHMNLFYLFQKLVNFVQCCHLNLF